MITKNVVKKISGLLKNTLNKFKAFRNFSGIGYIVIKRIKNSRENL
ncbi:hypothetical protein CHRYSEO8AT_300043 [Chryseobacterium sp. 8AT]|nr:hypothetical protein CHRYSEO8AT_300043 [Chryseobacterium sp. 8AT]